MPENITAEQLQTLCEILHVSVHRPRLVFKIREATVRVGDLDVSDGKAATKPSWKLMPTELEAGLDAVENSVIRAMNEFSVRFRSRASGDLLGDDSFQIKGLYLVPLSASDRLLRQIDAYSKQLNDLVMEWTADESRLHEAIRSKVGAEVFSLARKYIPTGRKMREATGIDAVSIPIGSNLPAMSERVNSEFLRQARARTQEMLTQVTENLFAQPRQELADAVSQLHDLISRDGRVSTKSIAPIRRAIDKLKLFEFVSDKDLSRQIEDMESRLDSMVPSEQTSTVATQNGLLALLRNVKESAISETRISSQVSSFRRRVKV